MLFATLLVSACDPVFSLKHTLSTEGSVTDACIVAAAGTLKDDVVIRHVDNPDPRRAFEEYTLGNERVRVEVLWTHGTPNRIEIGTLGIGYADAARDKNLCALMRSFGDALIESCRLDRKKVSVQEAYVRASCP